MMKDLKHTPGPWFIQYETTARFHIGPSDNYHLISANKGVCSEARAEANAKLIAAAPDLLEALQAMVQDARQPWQFSNPAKVLEKARAAIAKATE